MIPAALANPGATKYNQWSLKTWYPSGGPRMAKIKVSVERIDGYCNLPMQVGDFFYVQGSKLTMPEGKHICIWALQCMMPVFPILLEKEKLDEEHWVRKISTFSCPDPKGLVQFRLEILKET